MGYTDPVKIRGKVLGGPWRAKKMLVTYFLTICSPKRPCFWSKYLAKSIDIGVENQTFRTFKENWAVFERDEEVKTFLVRDQQYSDRFL